MMMYDYDIGDDNDNGTSNDDSNDAVADDVGDDCINEENEYGHDGVHDNDFDSAAADDSELAESWRMEGGSRWGGDGIRG